MKIALRGRGDFGEWRDAARSALAHGTDPRDIDWTIQGTDDLFGGGEVAPALPVTPPAMSVPKSFIDLAEEMLCHSDPARFPLAYRLLWRLQAEKHLLEVVSDPDVARARLMVRSVHRDYHKMTAFVRFKEVLVKEVPADGSRRAFVAWFEPDHYVVARTAPFFQRRFTDMDWVIATPKGSSTWDGQALRVDDEPAQRPDIHDDADELWRTYFSNIFNPARLKVKMMQTEMPKKYWKNLPEADLIPDLIATAEQRVRAMAERETGGPAPKFHDRLQERNK